MTRQISKTGNIGIFDSGIGGVTVLKEIIKKSTIILWILEIIKIKVLHIH